MNPNQANRARIAQRIDPANLRTRPTVLAPSTPIGATGPVRRTRCAPMTAAQRDSTGKRSDWSASPYFFTDPKWSATCSQV